MSFFVAKGILAIVGVVLLFLHMRTARRALVSLGQWLRYLTLLYFAVLMAGASADQWTSNLDVTWYNIGGLIGAVLLIVTMVVSIRGSRRDD